VQSKRTILSLLIAGYIVLFISAPLQSQTWQEYLERAINNKKRGYCADSSIHLTSLALKNARAVLPETDTTITKIHFLLSDFIRCAEDNSSADKILTESAKYRMSILDSLIIEFGEYSEMVAVQYRFLADLYNQISIDDSAKVYYQKTLNIKKGIGIDGLEIADLLTKIAINNQNIAESEQLLQKALKIRKDHYGNDHTDVGRCYYELALKYMDDHRYSKGLLYSNKAINIFQRAGPNNEKWIANCLYLNSQIYNILGDPVNEIKSVLRIMDLIHLSHGDSVSDSANKDIEYIILSYKSLAGAYRNLGEIDSAGIYYNKAENLIYDLYGIQSDKYIEIASELAKFYANTGNELYAELYGTFKEVLGDFKKLAIYYKKDSLNLNHPISSDSIVLEIDFVTIKEHLENASEYASSGDTYTADSIYSNIRELALSKFGADDWRFANVLNELFKHYVIYGFPDYISPYDMHQEILDIYSIHFGKKSNYILNQELIYLFHLILTNQREKEESLLAKILDNYNVELGDFHNIDLKSDIKYSTLSKSTLSFLTNGWLLREAGRYGACLDLSYLAFKLHYNKFISHCRWSREKEALQLSNVFKVSANNYISQYFNIIDQPYFSEYSNNLQFIHYHIDSIINVILIAKGAVSDEIFSRQSLSTRDKYPYVKTILDSLQQLKTVSSKYAINHSSNNDTILNMYNILISELEIKLAELKIKSQEDNTHLLIDANHVRNRIPDSTLYIEYIKYDDYQDFDKVASVITNPQYLGGIEKYVALAVDSYGRKEIFNLGESKKIDSLIDTYQQHLFRAARNNRIPDNSELNEIKILLAKIYKLLFKNLNFDYSKYKYLFIAPDDKLNFVSFASLVTPNGSYLIEEIPIHYLSTGRDLLRLKRGYDRGKGLLAIGDPDFNADIEARLENVDTSTSIEIAAVKREGPRNLTSECFSLDSLDVQQIYSTREEIIKVRDNYSNWDENKCNIYLGTSASEDNFKINAPGKEIIHISTHGYYVRKECRENFEDGLEISEENPLLHSGLLFSGCNTIASNPEKMPIEDGVMSAYEITEMDLSGVELVVLSACESGLGDTESGEGVYGLRRAFQMAGARTVISTLWPIPSDLTALMLGPLYSENNMNYPELLQKLQVRQIKMLRNSGLPDHPYSWGAFISIGDWK